MSERGSYVTQWIYCERCRAGVADAIDAAGCGVFRPYDLVDGPRPIFVGQVGGTAPGEEFRILEWELAHAIAERICHPLRIAVLTDSSGSRIYQINPQSGVSDAKREPFLILCDEAGPFADRPERETHQ